MARYRLTLAYDGTDYCGWQVQPNAATIQGALEEALLRMAGHPLRVIAAGRTDSGVHAVGQVAHIEPEVTIPPGGLHRGLNSILPSDIRVLGIDIAAPDFHARYGARSKTYRYYLERGPVSSPFRNRFTHHYPHSLDVDQMADAAARFRGRHDFAAFRAVSCDAHTTVRECTVSRFYSEGTELVYEITANGFLRHMVRNVVGTLLDVGRERLRPADIDTLFQHRDRRLSGPTAPAAGLHLVRVEY